MFAETCNRTGLTGNELRSLADRILAEQEDRSRGKRNSLRARRIAEDAHVRIEQPGGNVSEWQACTVCIARDELWLLIDTFVHRDSRLRVSILSQKGQREEMSGHALDSRHVHKRLHCLIVRLDEGIEAEHYLLDQKEIDRLRAEEFERLPPIEGRVLVLTASAAEMMIISHWLREIGLVCPQVTDLQTAVTQVKRTIYDVVLVDADCVGDGPEEILARLRHSGYKGEIVMLTANRSHIDSEFIDCTKIAKPVAQTTLVKAIRDAVANASGMTDLTPIRSTLPRSPELDAAVRRYVQEVSQDGRGILQALSHNDASTARAIVTRLEGSGAMFGYELLTQCAAEVQESLETAASLSEASRSLHRLASLCERIAADTSRSTEPSRAAA